MISLEAQRNIISITLALNVSFTTITFTKGEFGNHQYNVQSDYGVNYSKELEDYDNQEYPEDEIIDSNKKYITLAIKNCFTNKDDGNNNKTAKKKINFLQ
jgi:hypothetical protein